MFLQESFITENASLLY